MTTGCFGGESATENTDADLASVVGSIDGTTSAGLSASTAFAVIEPRIDGYVDDGIAAVVVPSDDALFALDADRLAELAGEGSIESLVLTLPPSDDVDLGSLESAGDWEGFVFDQTGDAHLVHTGSDPPTFGGRAVVDVQRFDDLVVIVIDGVIDGREVDS